MIDGTLSSTKKDQVDKFEKKARQILHGISPETVPVKIECSLNAGDDYITIKEALNIWNDEPVTIEHKPGQVILIDFWATWCPPCQAPMAHNQKMLENHGKVWGDKVRIVGVSIDNSTDVVRKHVKAKKWETVEHFHKGGSSADTDYGVNGVPHVVLIDTHGKIAFAGHPASRKLEQDIETLLKGEKLSGEGVVSSEASTGVET